MRPWFKHVRCLSRSYALLLLVFISMGTSYSQHRMVLPIGIEPTFFKAMPAFDIMNTDSAASAQRRRFDDQLYEKLHFKGFNFRVNIRPEKDGAWYQYHAEYDSWLVKIRSKGAKSLGLVLTDLRLESGEKLFVYTPSELRVFDKEQLQGAILPLDFFDGEEIVIEYDVPIINKNRGSFVIDRVSHGVDNKMPSANTDNKRGTDDPCYTCFEGNFWSNDKRAVVKITNYSENGTVECTGTLVNNVQQDKRPYILTAQHCVPIDDDAQRSVFTFNFEDAICNGGRNVQTFSLSGATLRAALYRNDFSLLELHERPPLEFNPYYAGWDISDQHRNDVTCIHHPIGATKRMALSTGAVVTSDFDLEDSARPHTKNAFWYLYEWNLGVTERGSSGAPIFNKQHRVMGTLAGGKATCGFPYHDYFEKLSASWEATPYEDKQLKYWLDPLATGALSVDGLDPFEGLYVSCDSLRNIQLDESYTTIPYKDGVGFYAGFNNDQIASYAEFFSNTQQARITGASLNVGSINTEAAGGIIVTVNTVENGLPGEAVSTVYVPYQKLKLGANYVSFYPYVTTEADFFITYTISYSEGDLFALQQAPFHEGGNTAFAMMPSEGWKKMSGIHPDGLSTSLAIDAYLCHDITAPISPTITNIRLYPNPTSKTLIATLPDKQVAIGAEIIDMCGRQHPVYCSTYADTVIFFTSDLEPGLYVMRLTTASGVYITKFIKQ